MPESNCDNYANQIVAMRSQNRRMYNKFLDNLIENKKAEFKIETKISKQTVRNPLIRKNHNPRHRVTRSPLEDAEEALVIICIQIGTICQPLTVKEGIELMNSLIDGTRLQKLVSEFQIARQVGNDLFKPGEIGNEWWQRFLKQNEHCIVTQQGEKFAVDRSDWTTLEKITQMYDIVYDEMVGAKVATKLETPMFMNQKGEQVDESQRFGKEVDMQLTYPNYVLFRDETGCNTSMKKDGHIAGTKYITKRGTRAQRMASTSKGCFTVLPIIASSGEPVCCIIIFQSKLSEPKLEWGMGIDRKVDPIRDLKGDIDVIASSGPGKYLPGGPQYIFNGKN